MVKTPDILPFDPHDMLKNPSMRLFLTMLLMLLLNACSPRPTEAQFTAASGQFDGTVWSLLTNDQAPDVSFGFVMPDGGRITSIGATAYEPGDSADIQNGGYTEEKKQQNFTFRVRLADLDGMHGFSIDYRKCLEQVCTDEVIPVRVQLDRSTPPITVTGQIQIQKGIACVTFGTSPGGRISAYTDQGTLAAPPTTAGPDGNTQVCYPPNPGKSNLIGQATSPAGNVSEPLPVPVDYEPQKEFHVGWAEHDQATHKTVVHGTIDPNGNLAQVLKVMCTSTPLIPGVEASTDGIGQVRDGEFTATCEGPTALGGDAYNQKVTIHYFDGQHREFVTVVDGNAQDMPGELKLLVYAVLAMAGMLVFIGISRPVRKIRTTVSAGQRKYEAEAVPNLVARSLSMGWNDNATRSSLSNETRGLFDRELLPHIEAVKEIRNTQTLNDFFRLALAEIVALDRVSHSSSTILNGQESVAAELVSSIASTVEGFRSVVEMRNASLLPPERFDHKEAIEETTVQLFLLLDFYRKLNTTQLTVGRSPVAKAISQSKEWGRAMSMLHELSIVTETKRRSSWLQIIPMPINKDNIGKVIDILEQWRMSEEAADLRRTYLKESK